MGSNTYDEEVLEIFLIRQRQLFPEDVAVTEEEAAEFLEDCMAYVCKDFDELKESLDETMDIVGMTDEDILASPEVFALPSGRYLVVEG